MSVTTRNPFDLLGNDAEQSPAAASAPKTEPKEIVAKQTTSRKRDTTQKTAAETRREGVPPSRGEGNGRPRSSANNKLAPNDNDSRPVEPAGGEAPARGGRGGRGGARGGASGRRRDFDRRNASGRTDTPKATEQPWGNEAEAQQASTAEAIDSHDPNAPEGETSPAAAVAVEEEDKTQSYEDYLKSKASSLSLGGELQTRRANEGADESKWADSVAFTRDDSQDAYFAGTQRAKTGTNKDRKQKEFLEIEQRFYEPSSSGGRGGRGGDSRGRGGARGANASSRGGQRGGRGGARGGRNDGPRSNAPARGGSSKGSAIALDESAFPALS
ncbi:hypothetical protein PYCC9005_002879 [Savitreella phatthalungensis]